MPDIPVTSPTSKHGEGWTSQTVKVDKQGRQNCIAHSLKQWLVLWRCGVLEGCGYVAWVHSQGGVSNGFLWVGLCEVSVDCLWFYVNAASCPVTICGFSSFSHLPAFSLFLFVIPENAPFASPCQIQSPCEYTSCFYWPITVWSRGRCRERLGASWGWMKRGEELGGDPLMLRPEQINSHF